MQALWLRCTLPVRSTVSPVALCMLWRKPHNPTAH